MLHRKVLKMEPLRLTNMHILLIGKITLPMLVCTDILALDLQIFNAFFKNNILFNTQKLKWALRLFNEIWGT